MMRRRQTAREDRRTRERTVSAAFAAAVVAMLAASIPVYSNAGGQMHHSMTISVYPPDNSLLATDTVFVDRAQLEAGAMVFLINRSLEIEDINSPYGAKWYSQEEVDPSELVADPDEEDIEFIGRGKGVFVEIAEPPDEHERIPVVITYSGVLYDSLVPPDRAYSRGFSTTSGLIDERGTYLTNESLWYPFQFDRSFTFRLTVDLPPDYMSISQGGLEREYLDEIRGEKRLVEVWVERNPTPEFYLVAGRYFRHQERHNNTRLMTYTYDTSDSLSQVYIDAARRYIEMYEDLIGEYPHPKFAMVENFWQTGYGMPSFTLLGDRVIRLPFIVHTSYGHEILHNWWGNCVYVDYDSGNWCEGLTTYGADYLYKERQSDDAAREYRHQTLITFNNYVNEESDFPLSAFRERHDTASQSVGYGKSLLVFHMLRRHLGDDIFWRSLRSFYSSNKYRIASWGDLEEAFTRTSGENLSWYFDQWVNSTGLPGISLESAWTERRGSRHAVVFTLRQTEPRFTVDIPIVVETETGRVDTSVRLAGKDGTFTVESEARPISLAIDPDFDMFRRLYTEEIPVTIGGAFANTEGTIIIGNGEDSGIRHSLSSVSHALGIQGGFVNEAALEPGAALELVGTDLWFLGRGDALQDVLRGTDVSLAANRVTLGAAEFEIAGRTLICTLRNPRDEEHIVSVIISEDTESLPSILRKLPHYGRNSYLLFEGERAEERGVWEAEDSPLRADFVSR